MHGLNGAAFMPRTGIRQPENGKSAIVGRFSGSLQGRGRCCIFAAHYFS